MPKHINPLSDRQLVFRDNYCTNGHNALKAYIDAGYSNINASGNAHALRVKHSMKQAIKTFMDECTEKAHWDFDVSIKAMDKLIEYLKPLAEKHNIAAINAITSIVKEKNCITGLQKIVAPTDTKDVPKVTDAEIARIRLITKNLALMKQEDIA